MVFRTPTPEKNLTCVNDALANQKRVFDVSPKLYFFAKPAVGGILLVKNLFPVFQQTVRPLWKGLLLVVTGVSTA